MGGSKIGENMNWIEIEKSYPKSFAKYLKFNVLNIDIIDSINRRDLYDFFDENGIIITIGHNSDLNLWDYDINSVIYYSIGIYNSRKEAESAAFTKAFEILENKLK